MTTQQRFDRWLAAGVVTDGQHAALSAIASRTHFSLFVELNALLYVGVVSFIAGLGWTIRSHFADLGDIAIVLGIAALFGVCTAYCFSRSRAYTPAAVPSPTFAFDYVLYLGCLAFAVGLGYLEFRFEVLKTRSDWYLLASALLYFAFAYRFDNRFVLSLGLSTLAGWFGVRAGLLGLHLTGSLREDALVYGCLVAASGLGLYRLGIKRHFLEPYLHVAAIVILGALLSGVFEGQRVALWLSLLIAAAGLSVERGVRVGRFMFLAYGVVYGYLGVSSQILKRVSSPTAWLLYIVVSGGAVILSLAVLSRSVGERS